MQWLSSAFDWKYYEENTSNMVWMNTFYWQCFCQKRSHFGSNIDCLLCWHVPLVDASTQHTHTNGEEAASKTVTHVYSYEIATPTTTPYKMFLLSMCWPMLGHLYGDFCPQAHSQPTCATTIGRQKLKITLHDIFVNQVPATEQVRRLCLRSFKHA